MSDEIARGGLSEVAPAKLNLALHVRRRRDDGYHDIETLFAFCENGDIVAARPDDRLSLIITGRFAGALRSTEDNLVLKAARALGDAAGIAPTGALTLDKRLPIASGIAGGSADAAATLRALNRLWGLNCSLDRLASVGAQLGADVPACVYSELAHGTGTGADLERVDDASWRGRRILLVNPGVSVSTPEIFKAWDGEDRGRLDICAVDAAFRNDLTGPAIGEAPQVAEVLAWLAGLGGDFVRMSGSGATCFAIVPDDLDLREALSDAEKRGWWTMDTRLR
ncbi:MAG: 4-(cytidine 5'-diphospho)-2-C-methyl-D-erythritol kinase [Pacificimonas sp.]